MLWKPIFLSMSPAMKSLDSLLQSLRLQSAIQNRVVLGEPWGVEFPAEAGTGKFHFIEQGEAVVAIPGQEPVRVQAGDFMLVRGDKGHAVYDVRGTAPTDLLELLRRAELLCESGLTLRFGGDGPETAVLSGKFVCADAETHPLWRALPPMILLRGEEGRAVDWLETTLQFLSCEATSVRPGAPAVLDRLCDVLFIHALRGWVRQSGEGEGWPAAVRDPAVDQALELIHRSPSEPWTVASLAERVAMSRSAFAERFRRLAGDPPMDYLARWRMHLAARQLRESRDPVATVAERVGYESEAAFAKAFKRMLGVAPGAYRRAAA